MKEYIEQLKDKRRELLEKRKEHLKQLRENKKRLKQILKEIVSVIKSEEVNNHIKKIVEYDLAFRDLVKNNYIEIDFDFKFESETIKRLRKEFERKCNKLKYTKEYEDYLLTNETNGYISDSRWSLSPSVKYVREMIIPVLRKAGFSAVVSDTKMILIELKK